LNRALIDLEHLRTWVGRERTDTDTACVRHANLMAATVDRGGERLRAGDPLPPLWHWIYFLEGLPPGELGRDGHPARGAFLPPVPFSNRMWAGGRVDFEAAVPLGAALEKRSRVQSVEHKHGRSGDLVFVTVLHEILVDGRRAIREEHDLVYRDAAPDAISPPQADARVAQFTREVLPNTTTLFRYSALTFNGHRIHYDLDYCRTVEGYGNLVIHGPLSATWLAGYGEEVGGRRLRHFAYRGVRPALLGNALRLNATLVGSRLELWMTLADGTVSMQASAELA
jgi:3-methylfumaryl-CoA hydratase